MQLSYIASRLYGTPLMLARSKLDIILSVLGERIGWSGSVTDLKPAVVTGVASSGAARSVTDLQGAASGIAVIGVQGSLVRRNIGLEAQSGLLSYAEIAASLEAAAADPSVAGILLDIDSPGGEAGGVFELAQRVREIDAIKPVWALICDSAFSAAYAIACAASKVLVTQTSGVGSIGVIAMHVDQSARDAQQGYRFTPVTAGERKNDLSPHEPLNRAALASLQAEVDRLYGLFVEHVAAMRSIPVNTVRAGEAACFFGPDAVRSGLADALVRSDQVIAEFASFLSQRQVHSHFGASAARVLAISSEAFGLKDVAPTSSTAEANPPLSQVLPVLNLNPKEISMTQEDQSHAAPLDAPETVAPDQAPAESKPAEPPPEAAVAAAVADTDEAQLAPAAQPVPSSVFEAAAATAVSAGATPPAMPSAAGLAAHAQAVEIAELCQLAGQSTRIAGFLAQGATAGQVRQALLLERAQGDEITSLIHPDAPARSASGAGGAAHALTAVLMDAVRKLTPSR